MDKVYKYTVLSASRVLEIIEEFVRIGPIVTIKDLSTNLKLGKSNVHRFLSTLEMIGYIEQVTERGGYKLTSKLYELGMKSISSLDILEQSSETCREISNISKETVHLVVLNGSRAIFINKISQHDLVTCSGIGLTAPAHCIASGKVLLAYLPLGMLNKILDGKPLEASTEKTITNKRIFLKQLETIRLQGYATEFEEYERGVCCVAAPIRRFDGQIAAALSITSLAINFNETKWESMIQLVIQGAATISKTLGYINPKNTVDVISLNHKKVQ